ncbi:BolA family protein [Vitreoscilla filiformis]|jgi:BolA protein|nr:BolA family protein [Vitreoscilla filiformis]
MTTMPPATVAAIEAALRAELAPLELTVRDDSAAHAGHAGAGDGSHFSLQITSERFAGLGRVARHRLVYHALRHLLPQGGGPGIHALVIDARAPGEA